MAKPRTPKGRAREVARRLCEDYPQAPCELSYRNPFELLVATILSAQSTDVTINRITPKLFDRFPTAEDLAHADPAEVEQLVFASGFYKAKTRSIVGMANRLVEHYGGEVPGAMEDLVSLPGVGRKTANVVRSVALDLPGLPVDTHVQRLTRRLGITTQTDPVKIEYEVNAMLAPQELGSFSLRLILHGRRVCAARKPKCSECSLEDICPASELPTRRRQQA